MSKANHSPIVISAVAGGNRSRLLNLRQRHSGMTTMVGIALSSFLAICVGPLFADDSTMAGHTAAPPVSTPSAAAKPATTGDGSAKDGELSATSTGVNKQKMTIGKVDPPAAFNLEDIQNFPEERLRPVLNNPIAFEEGRDFSNLMESQDEKLIHPWLPEIPKAPYLTMKTEIDKPAKDWSFSVIDQGGNTVSSQDGRGSPPSSFTWAGEDKTRGYLAVDTVYIPQLSITDKDGYRHTYPGKPAQFAVLLFKEKGRTVIELSSKRLFADKKSDLSKEAPVFLDKVADLIREESKIPFGLQAYDVDTDLARAREATLQKYFSEKLLIPDNQISLLDPADPEKRGMAIAVILNGTPGGAQ